MLWRMVIKACHEKIGRILLALTAITVGTTLASTLLGIAYDIEQKMTHELRAYGANLVITPLEDYTREALYPPSERYFEQPVLDALIPLLDQSEVIASAPYLYGVVQVKTARVILTGTSLEAVRRMNPFWQVGPGQWPDYAGWQGSSAETIPAVLVGETAAQHLQLRVGDRLTLKGNGEPQTVRVAGILSTGISEDHQILAPLALTQAVLGRPGQVNLVYVSALGAGAVTRLVTDIAGLVPGAIPKPIRQIAATEGVILERIKGLIGLITVITLITTLLCVMTTMTALVVERQQEIGLLKAIGADSTQVGLLLFGEAGMIGLVGGLLGYGVGLGLAQLVGETTFHSSITPRLPVFLMVLGLALATALVAGIVPVRRALGLEPAVVLRGE